MQVERDRNAVPEERRRANRPAPPQLEQQYDDYREDPRVHEAPVTCLELREHVRVERVDVAAEERGGGVQPQPVEQREHREPGEREAGEHEEVQGGDDPDHALRGPDERRLDGVRDLNRGRPLGALGRVHQPVVLERERRLAPAARPPSSRASRRWRPTARRRRSSRGARRAATSQRTVTTTKAPRTIE